MFKSFFLAGFEGTTGYNVYRQWIDQVAATGHDRYVDEDYALLTQAGMFAARESVRWPLVDFRGHYAFSTLDPFLAAAERHGLDIIYDLFHFGYPEDVDLFSEDFPIRFADYCYAAARYIMARTEGPCYFTPLNEPSYFSWAAGEVGLFAPHRMGCGWELKLCLLRAAIVGINAIRSACPYARIVNADPLCRVVAPLNRPDLWEQAEHFNRTIVFQSWDMLYGSLMPEFGGSPSHLDIIGVNYYWTNQWDLTRPGVPLAPRDPRYLGVGKLLERVAQRYGAQLLITETSHVGLNRATWLKELVSETEVLLDRGIPLRGICLYPVTSMPEWHVRDEWVHMGIWDLVTEGARLRRIGNQPVLQALREAQRRLDGMQMESGLVAN